MLHRFTFLQQLAAELVYRAALIPAQDTGNLADCARAVGMRVPRFRRALHALDVIRCDLIEYQQPARGNEFPLDVVKAWARVLAADDNPPDTDKD